MKMKKVDTHMTMASAQEWIGYAAAQDNHACVIILNTHNGTIFLGKSHSLLSVFVVVCF